MKAPSLTHTLTHTHTHTLTPSSPRVRVRVRARTSMHLPTHAMNACNRTTALRRTRLLFQKILPRRPELLVFAGLIILFSGPVLWGSMWQSMVFQPVAVRSGEWWRVLTHPFVHVTWYHLLLDATA